MKEIFLYFRFVIFGCWRWWLWWQGKKKKKFPVTLSQITFLDLFIGIMFDVLCPSFLFWKKKKKIEKESCPPSLLSCRVLLAIKNEFYCISFNWFSRPVFSYRLWQREIPTWISFCNGKGYFLAQQIPFESGQIVKHFFVMAALA